MTINIGSELAVVIMFVVFIIAITMIAWRVFK